MLDIVKAIQDEKALRPYFKDGLDSWKNWLVFFKVISGYAKLSSQEMAVFQECTGLKKLPQKPIKECFLCCGRRSGKSTITAILAVCYALWGGWEKYASPGESVKVFIIATNMTQGKIIKGYIDAILELSNSFWAEVKRALSDSVELVNGVEIIIKPASVRSTRGFTCGLVILEECAFFRFEEESTIRDKELYTALKPSLKTIKNSLMIGLSTPFARQGLLWEKYNTHFGKPGSTLIWTAPTWRLNLTLTKEELEEEKEVMGEAEWGAEYGANFREDISSYLPTSIIDRAIVDGQTVVPPEDGNYYFGFCDSSEGLRKGGDSMTFAVAHAEQYDQEKILILDLVMEFQPPFSPEQVITDIGEVCKRYNIERIVQDRHSIAWIAADFWNCFEIQVTPSDKNKSQIYELLAVEMNKNTVELLDNQRLRSQIMGLHRFVRSGGMVKIDHIRGHDDLINSAAGAIGLALASETERPEIIVLG